MDWFEATVRYVFNLFDIDAAELDDENVTRRKILVFGSAGAGKSSFINALTGSDLPTGNGARGVTLESKEVPFERDDEEYLFYDTVGLNEAQGGSVNGVEAIKKLVKLVNGFKSGLNCIVMVMKGERTLNHIKGNYDLFVNAMTGHKVPVIILATHLEREESDDMQDWIKDNKDWLEGCGLKADEHVATTFLTPRPRDGQYIKDRVQESIALSWRAISKHSNRRVDFMAQNGGFVRVIRVMYNQVSRWFSRQFRRNWIPLWVTADFVQLIDQAGEFDSRAEAEEAAREIVRRSEVGM